MTAYESIHKLLRGHDCVIPLSASAFCDLYDGRLSSDQRQRLLEKVCEHVRANLPPAVQSEA